MAKTNSREARGYGPRHRRMREIVAIEVERGDVACAKCGELIAPGTPFHLGHNDDRTGWTGAEHALCNLRAAGKKGYAVLRKRDFERDVQEWREEDWGHSREW